MQVLGGCPSRAKKDGALARYTTECAGTWAAPAAGVHPEVLAPLDRTAALERLLWTLAGDASAWRALPRDVPDWWRVRAASRIARDGRRWKAPGPAAGTATIRAVAPKLAPATASA